MYFFFYSQFHKNQITKQMYIIYKKIYCEKIGLQNIISDSQIESSLNCFCLLFFKRFLFHHERITNHIFIKRIFSPLLLSHFSLFKKPSSLLEEFVCATSFRSGQMKASEKTYFEIICDAVGKVKGG